jgi:Amt family ammonium transporter
MMPALAFFEAGLLRRKNTVSILMQIFVGLSTLAVLWHIVGFSLVYGPDRASLIGDFSYAFFRNINNVCLKQFAPRIPGLAFALFQMMFAAITPLLMTGSFAERLKFKVFLWFIVLCSPSG